METDRPHESLRILIGTEGHHYQEQQHRIRRQSSPRQIWLKQNIINIKNMIPKVISLSIKHITLKYLIKDYP